MVYLYHDYLISFLPLSKIVQFHKPCFNIFITEPFYKSMTIKKFLSEDWH